jgi:uncharacterized protein (TIGR03435 family)
MFRRSVTCFICVVSASLAFGQTPAFEVAAVKPSDPTSTVAIHRSGYHLATVNTSLLFLITWAYDMHRDRIYGQPGWLDSVHYDIVANAPGWDLRAHRQPGELTPLQQMMQALLAERFNLALHRETRGLPIYALVVAKSGPKFRLREAPEIFGQNPFAGSGRGRLVGTEVNAEMLAKVLCDAAGRSVQDQTGLKGVFDFKLDWEPDELSAGPEGVAGRTGASLFTAIQEQLGLKLEARRGPVEVLVIDHIDRAPKEN